MCEGARAVLAVLTQRIVGLVSREELARIARDERALGSRDGAVVGLVDPPEHAPHEDLFSRQQKLLKAGTGCAH